MACAEAPVREWVGADALPLVLGTVVGWRSWRLADGVRAQICANTLSEDHGEGGQYHVGPGGPRLKHRPATSFYFDPIYPPTAGGYERGGDRRLPVAVHHHVTARMLAQPLRLATQQLGLFISVRGWDTFMLDSTGAAALAEQLLDNMVESYLASIKRYFEALGESLEVIQVGGDLGAQRGP